MAVADQAPHAGPAADLRIVPMRGAEPVIVVNHEPCRERLATDSAPTLLLRVKPRDLDPRQTLRVRVGIRRSFTESGRCRRWRTAGADRSLIRTESAHQS